MHDPYEGLETAVLPNGLTVHVAHWPNRPWVAAGFVVHSGARVDQIGLEGTAHFVEHLVSRNGSVPYEDIKKFFNKIGGSVDLGVTDHKSTMYKFFSPVTRAEFSEALSIFGEMLFSVKLNKFVEEQRRVIESEFYRKFPVPIVRDLIWRRNRDLFRGSWLERYISSLGEPDSIARISDADLQSYYDVNYTPANVSAVFVGGLSLSQVVDHLSSSPFAVSRKGERTPIPKTVADFQVPREPRYVFEISKHIQTAEPIEKAAYESRVVIPGAVKWPVLNVMNDMISRVLFNEVRERLGWTYAADVSRYDHQPFHEITIKCTGIPLDAVEQIEEVIETCVQSVAENSELFGETVHGMLVDIDSLDITGRGFRSRVADELAHKHQFTTNTEDCLEISKVTLSDVKETLKWLEPHRRRTLITVP